MKESSEIVKCPNCDGVGGWLKDDPPKRAEDRTYREVECPSCHGAGVFGVHGGLELDCDHCFGDGYIKEEVPVVTKRVSCSRCAGLGEISVVTRRVSCSRCAGLGEISDGVGSLYKCSDCDGMGFLYKQVEELPEDSQKEETVLQSCENCAGTGQIIKYSDPETYIREYVECRECKGTGKMPKREETEKEFCPRCGGDGGWLKSRSDGFVTCDLCDGTGKQPEKPQPEPKEQPKIHSKKQKYIGCYGVKVPVTKEEEQLVRLLGSLIEAQGKPAISLFKKVLKERYEAQVQLKYADEVAQELMKPKKEPVKAPPRVAHMSLPETHTSRLLSGLTQVNAVSMTTKMDMTGCALEAKLVGAGIIPLQRMFQENMFSAISDSFNELLDDRNKLREQVIQLEQEQEESAWTEALEAQQKKVQERDETESFVATEVLKKVDNELWGLKKPYITGELEIAPLVADLKRKAIIEELRNQTDPYMLGAFLRNEGKATREKQPVLSYACYIEAARMCRLSDSFETRQNCLLEAAESIKVFDPDRAIKVCDVVFHEIEAHTIHTVSLIACADRAVKMKKQIILDATKGVTLPERAGLPEGEKEEPIDSLFVSPDWVHIERSSLATYGFSWSDLVFGIQEHHKQLGDALTYALVEEAKPAKLRLAFLDGSTDQRKAFKIVSHYVTTGELSQLLDELFSIVVKVQIELRNPGSTTVKKSVDGKEKAENPFSASSQTLVSTGSPFITEGALPLGPTQEETKKSTYDRILAGIKERIPSADMAVGSKFRTIVDGMLSPIRGKTWSGDLDKYLDGLVIVLNSFHVEKIPPKKLSD